jgi:hypothetical protein
LVRGREAKVSHTIIGNDGRNFRAKRGGVIMNKIFSIVFVCAFVVVPAFSQADEIHEWQDAKGNWHISELPPDQPVKKYSRQTYTPESPQAIRNFKMKEKMREQHQEAIRKANAVANEESERRARSDSVNSDIRKKESELQDIVSRGNRGNLEEAQRQALEAAAKKAELNRLTKQDPYYKPDPNAAEKNRLDDLEFELRQQKSDLMWERFNRETDKAFGGR